MVSDHKKFATDRILDRLQGLPGYARGSDNSNLVFIESPSLIPRGFGSGAYLN